MAKSAPQLAAELLAADEDGMEELRIHEFEDEDSAFDEDLIERLYGEFDQEFDRVQAVLTKKYGEPDRTGEEDEDLIPLLGLLRFALWTVEDKILFAAVAHEDRGVPILLMLGTAS